MSTEMPWNWTVFGSSRNRGRPTKPTAAPAPELENQLITPVQSPPDVPASGFQQQFLLAETAQLPPPAPVHISTAQKETPCIGNGIKACSPAGDEAAKNPLGDAMVTAPQAQTVSQVQPRVYFRLRIKKRVPDQHEEKKEPGLIKNQHKVLPDQVEEEQEGKKNGVKKHEVVKESTNTDKEKKVPYEEEEQPRRITRKQVADQETHEVINNDITPVSKNLRSQTKLQKKGETGSTSSGLKTGGKTNNFSLSLSQKEIEEDFLFMTGRLPPRNPKRRPKAVRVDTLYPGSELKFVCEQLYAVQEKPVRKIKSLRDL